MERRGKRCLAVKRFCLSAAVLTAMKWPLPSQSRGCLRPPATISMVTKAGPHRSCLGVPPESMRAVQRYLGACFVAPPLEPEPGIQLRVQIVSQHCASCCSEANLDSTPTSLSPLLFFSLLYHSFSTLEILSCSPSSCHRKKISSSALSCSLPSNGVTEKNEKRDVRHSKTYFPSLVYLGKLYELHSSTQLFT